MTAVSLLNVENNINYGDYVRKMRHRIYHQKDSIYISNILKMIPRIWEQDCVKRDTIFRTLIGIEIDIEDSKRRCKNLYKLVYR